MALRNITPHEFLDAAGHGNQFVVRNYAMYRQDATALNYITGEMGDSALHLAARIGKAVIADILYDYPAFNRLATNDEGDTALHIAARNGHYDFCRTILEKDRLFHCSRNNAGETPLTVAHSSHHFKIVELFRGYKIKYHPDTPDSVSEIDALHQAIPRPSTSGMILSKLASEHVPSQSKTNNDILILALHKADLLLALYSEPGDLLDTEKQGQAMLNAHFVIQDRLKNQDASTGSVLFFDAIDLGFGSRKLQIDIGGFHLDPTAYDALYGEGAAEAKVSAMRAAIKFESNVGPDESFLNGFRQFILERQQGIGGDSATSTLGEAKAPSPRM